MIDPGAELACLSRSLALGLPEGYTQVYLQAGQPAAALLTSLVEQLWLLRRICRPHRASTLRQVKRLLDLFDPAQPIGPDGQMLPVQLVEPLTDESARCSNCSALGLSNKAIADRLVVSEGTIRTHVHNLIGKLGARAARTVGESAQLKLI